MSRRVRVREPGNERRAIARNDQYARDAVQNAATKALIALRRGDACTAVRAWLFRVAHNEAISLLRTRRPSAVLDDEHVQPGSDPHSALLVREELAAVV